MNRPARPIKPRSRATKRPQRAPASKGGLKRPPLPLAALALVVVVAVAVGAVMLAQGSGPTDHSYTLTGSGYPNGDNSNTRYTGGPPGGIQTQQIGRAHV